jgi:RNA polymerase sigma-70 factor (ECF subfamily)
VDREDAELVRLTLGGDHDAYRELVARYQGHVYGLAYSLVGDWHDAQDIAQETFIRAYGNLDALRDPARFPAWLRRVAFSVATNWLKAHRPGLFERLDGRVDLDHLEIPDFHPGSPEAVAKRDLADAVLAAVASLPPKYRVPLSMFHLDGLSYQKVADFLDIPLGTVKSLIHRARAKLKAVLAAYAAEEAVPVVQEVFNEHKLPEEFAGKVLEGIKDIGYDKSGETTLAGCVVACMDFLGTPVPYEYVMGVSGAAFKLLWSPKWCSSNNSMGILG